MIKKMVIDADKFLEFLDEMIRGTYVTEMRANKSEHPKPQDYIDSHDAVVDRNTFTWLRNTITGDEGTDLGDFMIEVYEFEGVEVTEGDE